MGLYNVWTVSTKHTHTAKHYLWNLKVVVGVRLKIYKLTTRWRHQTCYVKVLGFEQLEILWLFLFIYFFVKAPFSVHLHLLHPCTQTIKGR